MSMSTAIGSVGKSLKKLLESNSSFELEVTLLAPDETSSGQQRINLFLYRVQENAFLRNMDWQLKSGETDQKTPPPLSLSLFYLMTSYAQNDSLFGNVTTHEILGEAMRVFYEYAIIPREYLAEDLQQAREQLRIIPSELDLNELGQIWSTFGQPFRLSVPYEVSVVQIDQAQQAMIPKRVIEVGLPEIHTPLRLPIITQITPQKAAVGTEITFSGEHLADWQAQVTLGEHRVSITSLTSDVLTIVLPEIAPGFYPLQIDIAHLFRRTFWFEVLTS